MNQTLAQPSRSFYEWRRPTLLKRQQSHCLTSATIERIQWLLESHGTNDYWAATVSSAPMRKETGQGIFSDHEAGGFRKKPRPIYLICFCLQCLISPLIYILLICFLLPVLIFHSHSLFNFSTDSQNAEKGQDS